MQDIVKQIYSEIDEFNSQDIMIVDNYFFNQKATIDRIFRLYNSQFETGDTDTDGDKKYFQNILRNPCKTTTKAIDFDTKNINIMTAPGGDELVTWKFERDLKFWMKDKNFGMTLNRIFTEIPIFGSVVTKTIKGETYFVDLRNWMLNKSSDTLDESGYLIERHLYSIHSFEKAVKEFNWSEEESNKVIEDQRASKKPFIAVYERYGDVEIETGVWEYRRVFIGEAGFTAQDAIYDKPSKGYELKSDKIDTHPYWEYHFDKIPGRWLGVGNVEQLFDPQIRINELTNQSSKSTYWATLRVWQSQGADVNKNLNTDVVSGQILETESPITPVDMSDRDLGYFSEEFRRWLGNRDEMTFSYDVIQGERLPAGTPLGSAQLAAGMASSFFDFIRENLALSVKQYLFKVIIPQFEKESTLKHEILITGKDLDKARELKIREEAFSQLVKKITKDNKLPDPKWLEATRAAIGEKWKLKNEVSFEIPAGFYKDAKYKIDIIISGEQKDTQAMSQAYFSLLQAIGTDPTLLTDPVKKPILIKAAENSGINAMDLEPQVKQSGMDMLMNKYPTKGAGGGVSRPAAPVSPNATQAPPQTI